MIDTFAAGICWTIIGFAVLLLLSGTIGLLFSASNGRYPWAMLVYGVAGIALIIGGACHYVLAMR